MSGAYICLNGGSCMVTDDRVAFCNCIDQFEGKICELGEIVKLTVFLNVFFNLK